MNRTINRLKLIFLGLFVIGNVSIWSYQVFWKWPEQRCEAQGSWWDWRDRICATPMPLSTITGRFPGRPDLPSVAGIARTPAATPAAQAPAKP